MHEFQRETNSLKTFIIYLEKMLCQFQPSKDDSLNLNEVLSTLKTNHGRSSDIDNVCNLVDTHTDFDRS